jgi:hypothetical protein
MKSVLYISNVILFTVAYTLFSGQINERTQEELTSKIWGSHGGEYEGGWIMGCSAKAVPWLTRSFVSNQFLAHGLHIALILEAVRTSETLVNVY